MDRRRPNRTKHAKGGVNLPKSHTATEQYERGSSQDRADWHDQSWSIPVDKSARERRRNSTQYEMNRKCDRRTTATPVKTLEHRYVENRKRGGHQRCESQDKEAGAHDYPAVVKPAESSRLIRSVCFSGAQIDFFRQMRIVSLIGGPAASSTSLRQLVQV